MSVSFVISDGSKDDKEGCLAFIEKATRLLRVNECDESRRNVSSPAVYHVQDGELSHVPK
jgi:hypothetical protein